MTYHLRWRMPLVISVVFQIVFLGGIGWITANFFVPTEEEQYIEIDLVSENQREDLLPNVQKLPDNKQVSSMRTQEMASTSSQSAGPKVEVSANDMAIMSTEVPSSNGQTSSAISSNGASNNTGESNGNATTGSEPRKSSGVSRPSILRKVDPDYPESARQAAVEGTVIVKIRILKNGRPGNISISRTSGYGELDNAAIAAVQQWIFVPAKDRDSGEELISEVTIPVAFRLQ